MKDQIQSPVELPAGIFCGNCLDCWFAGERKADGRIHCEHPNAYGWNQPNQRNGCWGYK